MSFNLSPLSFYLLTPHVSRLTSHVSRLTSHVSRLTSFLLIVLPPARDRVTPAVSKGLGGDLEPWRGLTTLVLIEVQSAEHIRHHVRIEVVPGQVFRGEVSLHRPFQNAIQDVVRGQGVLVGLVRPELGRGGPGEDPFGNDAALPVDPAGKPVAEGLGDIGNYRKPLDRKSVV